MQTRSGELERRFADTTDEIVELRRNLDEMRLAATTDSLTGIANRKHFDIRLREYADDCARNGEPLSLLMGDVDHFKAFNDDHGHQVGDMVLRLVARTLAECVRGRDFVARYGGEEFVVLLPKTGLEGAFAVAENIRNTIASRRIARKSTGEQLGMVTLSFGLAQYKAGESLDSSSAAPTRGCIWPRSAAATGSTAPSRWPPRCAAAPASGRNVSARGFSSGAFLLLPSLFSSPPRKRGSIGSWISDRWLSVPVRTDRRKAAAGMTG